MATLPPVTLGAIIFGAFLVVFILRNPLQRRWVLSATISNRPMRQFGLDMALVMLAGILAFVYNAAVYKFPIPSGVSLMFGCLVAGFFIGLDLSLAREREIIRNAIDQKQHLSPGRRFFPVTRKFTLVAVAATLFVALIIVMVIGRDIAWLSQIEQTEEAFLAAQLSVAYEIFFVMAVLLAKMINLILSYSINLKLLFANETGILERVSRGDLSRLVPVATNDEFGIIADHTNSMIQGLRHRIQLISDLKVAEEVQKNLLPHTSPQVPGLEVSGVSIYCEQTGGDYFDYLHLADGKLGIVVADASDHGIGAAMHMTSARAMLLYGTRHNGSPSALVGEVNRLLAQDSSQTGWFVSLFLMEIDSDRRQLKWVRAGHEPAILYDPQEEKIETLDGGGIALGVDPSYRFEEESRNGWSTGSILIIGTDGLHETRNRKGEMFGRQRLHSILRNRAADSAETIQHSIVDSINEFRAGAPQEDDITLVVVKLQGR
jgi:sigma-B regulation protein RsbU (phosphoserine phosphatase)